MKNSEQFTKLIYDINLQNEDYIVGFDVVSLFTNLLMEEVLQVIRSRLSTDPSLPERSPLQVDDVTEVRGICFTTMYFEFEGTFYQQEEGMTMGNSLFLRGRNPLLNTLRK
jgi:hypothetical protein